MHACPYYCTESWQSSEEIKKDYDRLAELEVALDHLYIMRSCEWVKIKKTANFCSKLSVFIGRTNITSDELISAAKNNRFFGIMKVDIESPPDVIERYKRMNFPFIFRELEVTESMLSDGMLKQATENRRKFPQKCMTLIGMSYKPRPGKVVVYEVVFTLTKCHPKNRLTVRKNLLLRHPY